MRDFKLAMVAMSDTALTRSGAYKLGMTACCVLFLGGIHSHVEIFSAGYLEWQ